MHGREGKTEEGGGGRGSGRSEQQPNTQAKQNVPRHNVIGHQIIGLGSGWKDVPGRYERCQESVDDRPEEEGHIVLD